MKRVCWKHAWTVAAMFMLACAMTRATAGDELDMLTCEARDDFESGELSAWESYPYAQDPGFNPTLLTVSEPARGGGGLSLCQVLKPSGSDYPADLNRIGMVKRIRMQLTDDSRVKMAIFISADRRPARLKVLLCAADGTARAFAAEKPAVNAWLEIDARVAEFSSDKERAGDGLELQAVAVFAEFGVVSPARSYQLNLDDFSITGSRPRGFVGLEPATTRLDHFDRTILHRHYAPNETIALRVAPQQAESAGLDSARCTILDSAGEARAQAELKQGANGSWQGEGLYTIAPDDRPGQWKAVLEGRGASGRLVRDEFRFIVQPRRLTPADHPRLFFDARDLMALRNPSDPATRQLLEKALADARARTAKADPRDYPQAKNVNTESLGGPEYATEWADYGRWRKAMTAGYPLHDAAFLYAFTGEPAAGEQAAEFLLALARLQGWNHPWFDARHVQMYYPMGYAAYHAAMGYDLTADRFDAAERATARRGLLANVIEPAYACEVVNNGVPSDVSNHLGVSMGGTLLAIMALLGEDPANPDMEPYFSGMLAKLEAHLNAAYLADGSYAESFCYHHMDSETVSKALAALERTTGIDLTSTTHFRDAYRYALYASTADGQNCPDMGDALSYWTPDSKNHYLWLAKRMRDPLAQDRYRWMTGPDIAKKIPTDFFDVIWAQEDLPRQTIESLPPSTWFREKGNVILRSDWSAEGLLFNFRAGPHNNHYHFDQGSFLLRYGGEDLISEADYADYYHNLNYRPFYIQAIGHNTLLLNSHPESQATADMNNRIAALNGHPLIMACQTTGSFSYLEAELATVYKQRLRKYRRLFVRPSADYLVLCDIVEAERPETFNWIFHAKGGRDTIATEQNQLRFTRPKARLRMDVVTPANLTTKVLDYPDAPRAYVNLGTADPAGSARFVAVLLPMRPDNQQEREGWQVRAVDVPGRFGVRVQRGAETDEILFTNAGDSHGQEPTTVSVRTIPAK